MVMSHQHSMPLLLGQAHNPHRLGPLEQFLVLLNNHTRCQEGKETAVTQKGRAFDCLRCTRAVSSSTSRGLADYQDADDHSSKVSSSKCMGMKQEHRGRLGSMLHNPTGNSAQDTANARRLLQVAILEKWPPFLSQPNSNSLPDFILLS